MRKAFGVVYRTVRAQWVEVELGGYKGERVIELDVRLRGHGLTMNIGREEATSLRKRLEEMGC